MNFETIPEFDKDLKRLLKRFKTLEDDLEILKKALSVSPKAEPPRSYVIGGLGISEIEIIKIKRFACRALKGRGSNTGLRIIYALEADKITFIEIYFKGDKENEDRERIKRFT